MQSLAQFLWDRTDGYLHNLLFIKERKLKCHLNSSVWKCQLHLCTCEGVAQAFSGVCECVCECESVRVIFSRQEWGTWRAQSSGLPQVWPDRRCCWRRSVSVWERNISWHVVCAAVCLFLGKMNVTSTVQPSSLMWAVEKKNKKILFLFFNISFTFAAGTFSKLYVDTFSAFASLNFETL